jgi:hypothetical protein
MHFNHFFETNARRICEMHALIHQTLKRRKTPEGRDVWVKACADFHASYDALAFPGGYDSGLIRINQGAPEAIEAALVFLELRPYFFRSGCMREKFLRRLKHVQLTDSQARRFASVLEAQRQWRLESLAKCGK